MIRGMILQVTSHRDLGIVMVDLWSFGMKSDLQMRSFSSTHGLRAPKIASIPKSILIKSPLDAGETPHFWSRGPMCGPWGGHMEIAKSCRHGVR
jgi:hypothetical protein